MKKSISFALCFIFLFAVAQQTYAYALLGGKHKTNNLKFRITDFNGTYVNTPDSITPSEENQGELATIESVEDLNFK